MDVKRVILLICVLLLSMTSAIASQTDCIVYFYGKDCEGCQETNTVISNLENKYQNLNIERYEVYFNHSNMQLLEKYYSFYNIPDTSQRIPSIFMVGSYFIGNSTIHKLLEQRIKSNDDPTCPNLENNSVVGIVGQGSPYRVLETVSGEVLTISGMKDSFGTSMVALWILFILILAVKKDRKKMVHRGALFIAVVYAVNILFGIGWFSFISQSSFPLFFTKLTGFFALVYGGLRIYAFFKNEPFLASISLETRNVILRRSRYFVTSGGVIILAFIGGVLSFSRRSDTFQVLQSLYTEHAFGFAVLPYTLTYGFLLMLPMILVLPIFYHIKKKLEKTASHKAKNIEKKIDEWNDHHHKILNFVVHAILVILGILLLFF